MTTNSVSRPYLVGSILNAGTVGRITSQVSAVRRYMSRWQWPLPLNSVVAVFDDRTAALAAIGALADAGADPLDVWMVTGEDGARRLRETFARRGILSRLRSLLGDEAEIVAQLTAWGVRGATVALVRPPRERIEDAMDIFALHQARALRRTGRWVSEWIVRPVPQPALR